MIPTWLNHTEPGSSNNEAPTSIPAQCSSPSFFDEHLSGYSTPPELAEPNVIGALPVKNEESADTNLAIERYWIEKDEERLAVIADLEKTAAEVQEKLDNTTKAFRMASDANSKLQAELQKSSMCLSQQEDDMEDLSHELDAAEMGNENLEQELAQSRIDCKHQFDRAEEALILMQTRSSNETITRLLQMKASAEDRFTAYQREADSEVRDLESQLEERCNTVARLTRTLSRVADLDQWRDIEDELKDLLERAGKLPMDLEAARSECEEWKRKHASISQEHEMTLKERDSLQETLKTTTEYDLKTIRDLERKLAREAATPRRALKNCLKSVFERMIRCSICLERNGYQPFDENHQAIREEVLDLTGHDYQQPLIDHYDEYEICEEFLLSDEVGEDVDYAGRVHLPNMEAQAGNTEPLLHEEGKDCEEDPTAAGKPEAMNTLIFPKPASELTTSSAPFDSNSLDVGNGSTFDFNFGASESPLFAMPTPSSDAMPGEEAISSKIFKISKSVKVKNHRTAEKCSSHEDWSGTSFTPAENGSVAFEINPPAGLEDKSKDKAPICTSSETPQSAEENFSTSRLSETEDDHDAQTTNTAAPGMTMAATVPPQLQNFAFGGSNNPFTFIAGSSSLSAVEAQPTSAPASSSNEYDSPYMTVHQKENVVEKDVEEAETSRGDELKSEASAVKDPEEGSSFEKETSQKSQFEVDASTDSSSPNENAPDYPLTPSRSQKRATKKAEQRAAKKAESNARNEKTQASRRVQQALLMRR